MKGAFLKYAAMRLFGSFAHKTIGPFSPGLNVVFGRNEAGKTTIASFICGVLFGWEEARGNRNTYKPQHAERSGSLIFATPKGEVELSRTRNADGLQGDDTLVSDLDKDTFRTMFFLTADELRGLRNTTDITARLLTAGAGTESSPASALGKVQSKLAYHASRAAAAEDSLANVYNRYAQLRSQVAVAAAEEEKFCQEDQELREFETQREQIAAHLNKLNKVIEQATSVCAQVEKIDSEIEQLEEQIQTLQLDEEELNLQSDKYCQDSPYLSNLTVAQEANLRDRLDSLTAQETKLQHAIDLARNDVATSTATYEALQDMKSSVSHRRRRLQRSVQIVLSAVLSIVFLGAGVLFFYRGRAISSLSFTALGLGLFVFAFMLAIVAMVMLLRPDRAADEWEQRQENARWVMLQEKRKLEACQNDRETFYQQTKEELDSCGLKDAGGSLRCARQLLDEAKEMSSDRSLHQQRLQALIARRTSLEDALSRAEKQRNTLFSDIEQILHGVSLEQTVGALQELISQKTQQRSKLFDSLEGMNQRFGELKEALVQAKTCHDFDDLKLRCEQARTSLTESLKDCVRHLLARRMLESAIANWESESQPETYRRAGELLSMMTDGRWTTVSMTVDNYLTVSGDDKVSCNPVHLSLGTCQQLYLALRIALLETAQGVGRAIPILADDILVNFDAARRFGAAQALTELSKSRQVILFTCHEEVVAALQQADPTLNKVVL